MGVGLEIQVNSSGPVNRGVIQQKQSMPQHDSIDLKRWNELFPLDTSSPPSWDDVQSIAGPKTLL